MCSDECLKLFESGKYEETIKCYEKVIEIEPDNARAWYNKGLACIAVNRHDEGTMCLDKAVEIDPSWKETGEFS